MTKRAVNWADATVELERLAKYPAGLQPPSGLPHPDLDDV